VGCPGACRPGKKGGACPPIAAARAGVKSSGSNNSPLTTPLAHPHRSQATFLLPPALGCGGERSAGRFVPVPAAAAAAGQLPARAVVDEAIGECDEEVTLHGGLGLLDVEAVAQKAVEDALAVSAAAAGGTGGALGGATNPGDEFGQEHGLCASGRQLAS